MQKNVRKILEFHLDKVNSQNFYKVKKMKHSKLNYCVIVASIMLSACLYSCNKSTKQPETISVAEAYTDNPLENLKAGNKRFREGKSYKLHQDTQRIKELIKGQDPKVVVVGCSDSRTTPEIVFDQGLGDIFTIRTAGNVMNDYEEGSIEYAVEHAGSELVVVMGHTHCGAIHAMTEYDDDDDDSYDHIQSILKSIKKQLEQENVKGLNNDSIEYYATIANIKHGVKQLRNSDPILKGKVENGDIQVIGAIYDIETGEVSFLDVE